MGRSGCKCMDDDRDRVRIGERGSIWHKERLLYGKGRYEAPARMLIGWGGVSMVC